MLDHSAKELSDATGWRRVLEAYATLAAAPVGRSSSSTDSDGQEALGWVPRLSRLDGVEPERLSALHGKLIALGLLSFEISGKLGMQYQVSPLGRRTLARDLGVESHPLEQSSDSQSDAVEIA